ncbi:MAG TPA: diguanylate cyclase [Dehalococcoidia bacterium]|nr:diguanylate cyclase [Dehalococcoidia bacterium]
MRSLPISLTTALILGLLGLVHVAGGVMVFGQVGDQEMATRTVNLMARQRLLAQSMRLRTIEILAARDEAREDLRRERAEFSAALDSLNSGELGSLPETVRRWLRFLESLWAQQDARLLVAEKEDSDLPAITTAVQDVATMTPVIIKVVDSAVRSYEREYERQVRTIRALLVFGAGADGCLAVLGWLYLRQRITRPLSRLAEGAKRFSRGDLDFRVAIDADDELGLFAREFNKMAQELHAIHAQLSEQARRDSLTGVLNHAAIVADLGRLLESKPAARHAVLMADVRGMKAVNDTHGHPVGDEVLRLITRVLSAEEALVGRYGGDEFMVVLPHADPETASDYRKRTTEALRCISTELGLPLEAIDLTLGVAHYPQDGKTAEELIAAADAAMYRLRRPRAA